jgi:hypothetical protein
LVVVECASRARVWSVASRADTTSLAQGMADLAGLVD